MLQPPLVVFIDIDGTLVGDVTYILAKWDLVRRAAVKGSMKSLKAEVGHCLRTGLLRPHVSSSLKQIKDIYDGRIYFFLFTASEKTWADFLVPCIEKELGFKFQRPVFTRRDCLIDKDQYQKSLKCLLPRVSASLSKTGVVELGGKLQPHHLQEHCVLIDNTYVIHEAEKHKLIKCPTYNSVMPYDVLYNIPREQLHERWRAIGQVLAKHGLITHVERATTLNGFLSLYYLQLGRALAGARSDFASDRFFATLHKVFNVHRVKDLRKQNVKKIVDSIVA